MDNFLERYIGNTIAVIEPFGTTTGVLEEVIRQDNDPSGSFTQVRLSGTVMDGIELHESCSHNFFVSDAKVIPVEIDGRRLPADVGVYKFFHSDGKSSITAQLTADGKWFPFPYSYSEWRAGELFTFASWESTDDKTDIPYILNPADKSLYDQLVEEVGSLPGVNIIDVEALAYRLVVTERMFD